MLLFLLCMCVTCVMGATSMSITRIVRKEKIHVVKSDIRYDSYDEDVIRIQYLLNSEIEYKVTRNFVQSQISKAYFCFLATSRVTRLEV